MPSIPNLPDNIVLLGSAAAGKPVDRKVKARPVGGEIPLVAAARPALPALAEGQRPVARQCDNDEGGGRVSLVHAGARWPAGLGGVLGERGDVAWQLLKTHVAKDTELRADENPAQDEVAGLNAIVRNNHSVAFVVEPGVSTN